MKSRSDDFPDLQHGDRILAKRMLRGDEAAFEEFFEDHFPGLYRFALARLQDPDLARDIVQNAICKAIAHLGTYRGEAPLSAWLYTICRHEISGHYRSKQRAPRPVDLVEEVPEVRAALESLAAGLERPDEALRRKEVARLVHVTLDHLPPRYGQALEWKYLDGLPVQEIADRLGLRLKAAESVLTRARKAFRDGFSSFGQSRPKTPMEGWSTSSA